MNKQEAIRKMYEEGLNCKPLKCASQYDKGYGNGIAFAINLLDKLDEPEKPVLTKKEAEWVDKLTDFYSLPDALYYITRCGYGYLFVFEMAKKTYELPVDSGATYGEFCELKERLVNAVVYGYEVEKKKLYTVEIPNPNGDGYSKTFLGKFKDDKVELCKWSCYTSIEFADNWKQEEYAQLTESEIKEDFDWAWQFAEEVEE